MKDIGKFEKNYPEIAVNLLGYPNQNISSLRISELNRKTVVNLLFLEADRGDSACLRLR